MVEIKEVVWTDNFEREFKKASESKIPRSFIAQFDAAYKSLCDKKVKDKLTKEKTKKQIIKIIKNPEIGKPLRFRLKGERTVYVKPYRMIYTPIEDKLYLLRFEHREKVYGR